MNCPSRDAAAGEQQHRAYPGDRDGPGQAISRDAKPQHRHRVTEPVPLLDQPLVRHSLEGLHQVEHDVRVGDSRRASSQFRSGCLLPSGHFGSLPGARVEVGPLIRRLPCPGDVQPRPHPPADDTRQEPDRTSSTIRLG
eukprot:3474994-Heterocapsa_arctica.AAC.1